MIGRRPTEKGLVLIAVVFALTAMTGLVLVLHAKMLSSMRTVDALAMSAKAFSCAQAGLEVAKALSWQDGPRSWPLQVSLVLGEARCSLEISDEQGRFNLNTILGPDGAVDQQRLGQLKRLIGLAGIDDKGLADRIAAWLARQRQAGKGKVSSMDEVLTMDVEDRQVLYRLLPYLTVHGDGLIDLNAAPALVLQACLDDQDLAARIIAKRASRPFGDVAELRNLGLDEMATSRLEGLFAVRSQAGWLRVRAAGQVGQVRRWICAIIHANPSTGAADVISYWQQCVW